MLQGVIGNGLIKKGATGPTLPFIVQSYVPFGDPDTTMVVFLLFNLPVNANGNTPDETFVVTHFVGDEGQTEQRIIVGVTQAGENLIQLDFDGFVNVNDIFTMIASPNWLDEVVQTSDGVFGNP